MVLVKHLLGYPGSLIGEANTGVTQASGDTGGELQDLLRFLRTDGEPGALLVRRSGDLMGEIIPPFFT